MNTITKLVSGIVCSSVVCMGQAFADDDTYEVTITNLTRGTLFTPVFVATHKKNKKMFELGEMASIEVANMAEGGDTSGLPSVLDTDNHASAGDLLHPGMSVTLMVEAGKGEKYLSVASMMLPTNDGFIAVNGVRLPKDGRTRTVMSPGYDAGSEPNDELCVSIPSCSGPSGAFSPGGGEDYVHIHAGIHGIGDLVAADHDWRNPAAKITIRSMDD